jgi:Protein of unknown function (DUF1194)
MPCISFVGTHAPWQTARMRTAGSLCRLVIVLALMVFGGQAGADSNVDLELVLAVDVSLSMDVEEQALQRGGYVAAFRDPGIIKAIKSGPNGRIAVVYIEWAGPPSQQVVVPWTMISDAASAEAFARRLEAQPISRLRMTSISSALIFSKSEFTRNPFKGLRRVIDVSGDGPNNSGPPVTPIRDELVASGVVINGLPVLLRPSNSGQFELRNLDEYYRDCVVGGPGSFVIPIRERDEFAKAIRQKLILEISGVMTAPRIIPAQASGPATGPKVDCMVGEQMWRRYYDGVIRN